MYHTIIDDSMVGKLSEKKDSIYIWCDADFSLWLHNLDGLCCGMFLSELAECHRFGIKFNRRYLSNWYQIRFEI